MSIVFIWSLFEQLFFRRTVNNNVQLVGDAALKVCCSSSNAGNFLSGA